MAVFPFYVEVKSSTRSTSATCGCRAKEGDMTTHIYQRDEGAITTPYKVYQYSDIIDGVLHLITEIKYKNPETDKYEVIHQHITKY